MKSKYDCFKIPPKTTRNKRNENDSLKLKKKKDEKQKQTKVIEQNDSQKG